MNRTILFAICLALLINGNPFSQNIPKSGEEVPSLSSFDEAVIAFMKKWSIPGGQLAVCKNGRLVYSRGFGYGDLSNTEPVSIKNLFRIASVSKPITAVAIMKLVEEKKISLDEKAFVILNDITQLPGKKVDPRLNDVTIRMLLEHAGGWTTEAGDRQVKYLRMAADAFGLPRPADARTIIRYAIGDSLDFTPGTEYAYSNFGYNILGRIIEKVTGKTYEKYLQEDILSTAGITDMQIGKTRLKDRLPSEVMYNDDKIGLFWSLLDNEEQMVTFPYGANFYLEVMDSHGGWLSNAEDLVRFITSVDTKTKRPHILKDETVKLMFSEPLVKNGYAEDRKSKGLTFKPDVYYAKGWIYEPSIDSWSHSGEIAGTSARILRTGDGVAVALIFNYISIFQMADYFKEMEMLVSEVPKGVTEWPEFDKWK